MQVPFQGEVCDRGIADGAFRADAVPVDPARDGDMLLQLKVLWTSIRPNLRADDRTSGFSGKYRMNAL
jgi:hypothetical protein